MGRDFAKGLQEYTSGDKALAAWTQVVKEFAGSMILILVAAQAGLAGGFNWAISFVVLSIVFGGEHHFNSFVTFYKCFVGSMCCVKGLMYLGAQFLGAFVAGKLGTALLGEAYKADTVAHFDIGNWQSGLQLFIAVSIFLWTYQHATSEESKVGDSMPRGIFLIASIAMCFMFQEDFVFSFHRCFQSQDTIKASGATALWGVVACIVTHVKAKLMGVEDKWFFEA